MTVFENFFCLGYFDQNGNSSDEYEFCIELNGKEPKKIFSLRKLNLMLGMLFYMRLN